MVTVENFVEHIDEFVEDVKRGETFTLLQQGLSVAEVRPLNDEIQFVQVPPPGVRPSDFTPTLRLAKTVRDAAELIGEDRDGEWEKNGV